MSEDEEDLWAEYEEIEIDDLPNGEDDIDEDLEECSCDCEGSDCDDDDCVCFCVDWAGCFCGEDD